MNPPPKASIVDPAEAVATSVSQPSECGSASSADPGADPSADTSAVPGLRSTLAGDATPVVLPRRLPIQRARPAQSNIPNARAERDRLRSAAALRIKELDLAPPIALPELRANALTVCDSAGLDRRYADYATVLLNNESWRDELAQVPYERRLLLLPKCLRVEEHCPAPFDQFGMLCKECGLCSIEDLTREAEALGYAVLIAEGSAIVSAMVETGKIEAIVGVSCLNVLEKCFPHLEAVAIPGMSIPLLQDDCVDTNVDLDQVRDLIHLSAEDRTYRLDLEGLKADVRSWFTPESLERVLGPSRGITDDIAREWLGAAGKRWRPYLAASMWVAVSSEGSSEAPELSPDLIKLSVAVECFHKASLVHDDIEDGDVRRYGEPTMHERHGVPVALNVGDLLLGEGYRLLSELTVSGDVRAELMAQAALGHVSLSRGQGTELAWTRSPVPMSSVEVLGIFREKTAPAFEVALRLGAILAGADADLLAILGPYSESLGIAYQIRDDIEDFTALESNGSPSPGSTHGTHGTHATNGVEVPQDSDDLADLRPSLILAIAHKRADEGPDRDLMESLWRREVDPSLVKRDVLALLSKHGIVGKASELCDAYERQAVEALHSLRHPTAKGLLRRVIGKIFGDGNLIEGYCSEFEARNAPGGAPSANPAG